MSTLDGHPDAAAAAGGESIERELRAIRELLGMEVAWVAEYAFEAPDPHLLVDDPKPDTRPANSLSGALGA